MKFILSNRHCEICYTSTGMKGMLTVEDDISIEFIKTEEEAAEYISDFLYRTNQDCDKCGVTLIFMGTTQKVSSFGTGKKFCL